MRALRVLGLDDGAEHGTGSNLVCEDPATGEQFSVPCDDRLRAGARGDLSRLGQLEIEMESQLRPRDIQAKIRAGATVEQVAALAGTAVTKVERFAYPVLQERISVADRARKARPTIDGIAAGASVQDTVAATLAARGHDGVVGWDAFKDEQGWVLTLTWNAGRSENRAQWLFHPGPDGGTLSARDDAAAEIVDPALRALRPLRPVRQDAVSNVLMDPTVPTSTGSAGPGSAAGTGSTGAPAGSSSRSSEPASRSTHPAGSRLPAAQRSRFGLPASTPFAPADSSTATSRTERLVADTVTDERAGVHSVPARAQVALTGTDSPARAMPAAPTPGRAPAATPGVTSATPGATSGATSATPGSITAAAPVLPAASGNGTAAAAADGAAAAPASPTKSSRRGQRPAMPSWEDVLLGTKSTGR